MKKRAIAFYVLIQLLVGILIFWRGDGHINSDLRSHIFGGYPGRNDMILYNNLLAYYLAGLIITGILTFFLIEGVTETAIPKAYALSKKLLDDLESRGYRYREKPTALTILILLQIVAGLYAIYAGVLSSKFPFLQVISILSGIAQLLLAIGYHYGYESAWFIGLIFSILGILIGLFFPNAITIAWSFGTLLLLLNEGVRKYFRNSER
jgi:hypothetical protein